MLSIFSKKKLHGYSILKDAEYTNIRNPQLKIIAKEYDDYGYMDENVGKELDSLFADENYIIGIHRTGFAKMDSKMITDIFYHGLYNNGDANSSGVNDGKFTITKTVSLVDNLIYAMSILKTCERYKMSKGCIIVKIPKSYIGMAPGNVQPIFYRENSYMVRLIPEFIYGYIPVFNQRIDKIIHNPNYKDEHSLINDNFYYDTSVYYKAKRENRELLMLRPATILEKYRILFKAYKDTLEKYNYNQAVTALKALIDTHNVFYFSGDQNRINLSRYVNYSEIPKILAFGLNVDTKDINVLINIFNASVENSIAKKNTK